MSPMMSVEDVELLMVMVPPVPMDTSAARMRFGLRRR
jgi:hypothetical protein